MKIGLIVPYFGKLPCTFQLWLKSAIINNKIDFHLIIDQQIDYKLPPHIIVHKMSFESLQQKIKQSLNTMIKSPYKLCDYKPTYGYLFKDIIKDYDYWGYSDIDLVYGNLTKFINDRRIFGYYDKIFDLGHLAFYKNNQKINEMFKSKLNGIVYWNYILNSEIIWVFDEAYSDGMIGINGIFKKKGYELFANRNYFSDINPRYIGFFDEWNQ